MAVRNWVALFLMGAINNLPYVIVNSAASTIADRFHQKNLIGVVFGANVALSAFVKCLNAFLLLNVSYRLRYVVNGCVMLLGLFGVAYAFNFGFAIGCIAIVGSTAAFGENVSLGLLSRFPSSLVNAWASGTGMAGVIGSTLYIIFGCTVGNGTGKDNELSTLTKYAFLLTTPVVLVYWFAYFIILKWPADDGGILAENTIDYSQNQNAKYDCDPPHVSERADNNAINAGDIQDGDECSDHASLLSTRESKGAQIWRCLKLIFWLAFNLCTVYVFEYVARACAAKVRPENEYNIGCPELYAALQFCYQAGVFVSRSSVQMFRIRRVEILTLLQLANMILWLIDVKYKFIPVAALPALMIFIGLLGGASYVNVFYSMLQEDRYPKKDQELCVNLTGLFINVGIIAGTGLETVLFITVLKS